VYISGKPAFPAKELVEAKQQYKVASKDNLLILNGFLLIISNQDIGLAGYIGVPCSHVDQAAGCFSY
jgi:hypothetical protein